MGAKGSPFTSASDADRVSYQKGLCPNAERAHFERVITHEMFRPGMSKSDLDHVATAFHKVWDQLGSLRAS